MTRTITAALNKMHTMAVSAKSGTPARTAELTALHMTNAARRDYRMVRVTVAADARFGH